MTARRFSEFEIPTASAVVRVLGELGIEYVFGLSGGDTGRIVRALHTEETSVRMVTVKHESAASAMAEVYGRLTGKPGVLLGQGPWVLGLGILGLLEAHLSSSPVVVLADLSDSTGYVQHGPYQTGTGDYGTWDARSAFRAVTKRVFEARTPAEAVQSVQFAAKHAMAGEPGPVAVLFSSAALSGSVGPDTEPLLYATEHYLAATKPVASDAAVAGAVAALKGAEAPLLIAGNGAKLARATGALAAFAEQHDVPIATTAGGKGAVSEAHPLAIGVFGTFGAPETNDAVGSADVVIAVGTKLGASDTARENEALLSSRRQTIIQIDIEPLNVAWTYPSSCSIVGDAADALRRISEGLGGRRYGGSEKALQARRRGARLPVAAGSDGRLLPEAVVATLNDTLGDRAITTCDAGENRLFMLRYFAPKAAGTFLVSPGVGPMGYGLPAALAAQLLYPDRHVVAVVGDGGFSMSMHGLMTALEYGLPITVVILNNRALGWVVHGGSMPPATPWRDFDFAGIARQFGCAGTRITGQASLKEALEAAARTRDRPTVLDVAVSMDSTFKEITSPLVWNERS